MTEELVALAGRFKARYESCRARFRQACIGPARPGQEERLERAHKRESARFVRDYNDRLFQGLVIVSLAFILLFRFVIKSSLLETLGWLAFAFLQVGTSFKQGGLCPATAPCLSPNHHSALCRTCLWTVCMVITQAALI